MTNYINIFILLMLMTACDNKQAEKQKMVSENFACKKGEMKLAWYTSGQDQNAPIIKGHNTDFMILVDTTLKATNFVSVHEAYNRERSINLDTSHMAWTAHWNKLSTKEKLEKLKQEKASSLIRADAEHTLNNKGQQQVWIINHSNDTVAIQMQDGNYICILQALTKSGQWSPVEYWLFSTCGNSYHHKHFPPKMANSFVTKLPNEGNYKTKLRYKLLGADKFHYSNEFDGKINYCEFVEDSTSYHIRGGKLHPNFKLDSLINLVWP